MRQKKKLTVWQMVRQAVEDLGGKTNNVAIRDWILKHYPGTKENVLRGQIIVCTVNHPSRIHFPQNIKPRVAGNRYDFLFRPERGKIELYRPEKHGWWEIYRVNADRLAIRQIDSEAAKVGLEAAAEKAAQKKLRKARKNSRRDTPRL